jgi:hypothetical protein
MKLDIKAFSLSCGLTWGFGIFCLTWWIIAFEGATGQMTLIGHLYRGYNVSPIGSLIGLLWALPDGLIGGAIFAWLYNLFAAKSRGEAIGSREPITIAVRSKGGGGAR